MSSGREKVRNGLLVDGLGKPVDLNAVDWHVRQKNPSASPSEVQNETLEVIRSLVSDELFRLGALIDERKRFLVWKESLDHSMRKIAHVYVKHYDDPEKWMFSAWMELTNKGEQLARSLEEKAIDSYRWFLVEADPTRGDRGRTAVSPGCRRGREGNSLTPNKPAANGQIASGCRTHTVD